MSEKQQKTAKHRVENEIEIAEQEYVLSDIEALEYQAILEALDRMEAAVRKATEMPDGAEKYIDQETVLEILDEERKGLE